MHAISKYIIVKIEELYSEPIILGGPTFRPPIVPVIIKCSDSVIFFRSRLSILSLLHLNNGWDVLHSDDHYLISNGISDNLLTR